LSVALALIVGFMAVEVVAGILAHSLALLSDAAHMLVDASALVMSLIVIRLMRRPSRGNLTFGLKRSEILSAQANGGTLLVLAGLIIYEGIHRLVTPPPAEGLVILLVALVGISVNVAATGQLAKANRESMNIEGSFQHLLTDLIAFIVTAIAGVVILATGWTRADGVAAHPHVENIHDLHVWEISSGFPLYQPTSLSIRATIATAFAGPWSSYSSSASRSTTPPFRSITHPAGGCSRSAIPAAMSAAVVVEVFARTLSRVARHVPRPLPCSGSIPACVFQ
jgi:Co/Zn/Cd efflux system component